MLGRKKLLQPEPWPEGLGPRALLENPDLAEAAALSAELRARGYVVAFCPGPREAVRGPRLRGASQWSDDPEVPAPAERCPLLCGAGCALAEEADVIVMTSTLADAPAIRCDHRWHERPLLVVEPGMRVDPAEVDAALRR